MKTIKLILMLAVIIAGTSCKKGEMGPEGPMGNANVVSKKIEAKDISWKQTVTFGTNYVVATIDIPEITQDIIDNGGVEVYGGFFWESPWSALPLSYYENGRTVYFTYGIAVGKLTLRMHNSTNTVPTAPGIPFKAVVIGGNKTD